MEEGLALSRICSVGTGKTRTLLSRIRVITYEFHHEPTKVVVLHGDNSRGGHIRHFEVVIPMEDIEDLCRLMRLAAAGPLGKLAIEAESKP